MISLCTGRGLCPAPYKNGARLPAGFDFLRPALDAGLASIDLMFVTDPSAPWPSRHLRNAQNPTLALLGDDPGDLDGQGGPTAWHCARQAADWCTVAIVHAAGGETFHYEVAGELARQTRRVLMVETTSRHASAWLDLLGCKTKLFIKPRLGAHPVQGLQ